MTEPTKRTLRTKQPRTWVYLFMARFAGLVESGAKPHTIRGIPRNGRVPKAGDRVSLRVGA